MGSSGVTRLIARIPYRKTVTVSTAAAVLAGGAMAVGAMPSSSGTIYGCYSKSGDLRIVDKNDRCGKKETRISWSKEGDKGATGATGPAGARPSVAPRRKNGRAATVATLARRLMNPPFVS